MNTFAQKPLPSVTDSEKAAISCALQCQQARVRALRELQEDHFHLPSHQIIWRVVRELGENANPVSIQEKLIQRELLDAAGGAAAVIDIFQVAPSVRLYNHYASEIHDSYDRRQAILAADRIRDAAQDLTSDDPEDECHFRKIAATALSAIAARRQGADAPNDVTGLISEYLDDFEARMEGRHNYGIKTRWEKLNAITGGIPNGNLIVIGGNRGSGKSILAQNIVEDALDADKMALWFSYEMPRREIMNRLLASQGSIPGRVLFDPQHNRPTQHQMQAMTRVLKTMKEDNLLRLRDQQLTVDEIRMETLDAMNKGDVGVIVVDYLQLVPPTDSKASREQQVSAISRKLRALALETDLPVVALSQLNKEGDSRESMAIEQDASVILKLCYPGKDQTARDKAMKDGDAVLKIDKNRNGQSGQGVKMQHEKGFFRFTEK